MLNEKSEKTRMKSEAWERGSSLGSNSDSPIGVLRQVLNMYPVFFDGVWGEVRKALREDFLVDKLIGATLGIGLRGREGNVMEERKLKGGEEKQKKKKQKKKTHQSPQKPLSTG